MRSLLVLPALAAAVIVSPRAEAGLVYSAEFDTPGDTETWTGINNTHVGNLSQTTASTGEGVLQFRQVNGNDPQLSSALASAISPDPGQFWSSIELRTRQLANDNSGGSDAPGAPLPFFSQGTAQFYFTPDASFAFQPGPFNFDTATNITREDQADGWTVFTFDLTEVFDGSVNRDVDTLIDNLRFDVIGSPTNAGNWSEIDYIRVSSIPEPSGLAFFLLGAMRLAIRRHPRVAA